MDLMEYVADLIQRLDKIAKYLDPNSTANFEDINDVMEKCISANIVLIEITMVTTGVGLKGLKNLCFRIGKMNKDIDFTDFNILFYNVDKSPDTLYFENAVYPIEGEEFEETNKEEDFEIK